MQIQINQLRDVDIIKGETVTIVLTEKDGNMYGSKTDIKIPSESYAMFEEAIVEKYLDGKSLE